MRVWKRKSIFQIQALFLQCIDAGQAFVYTGQEARPSVTVKTKDGKTLKEGMDYTLEYANNISASVNTVNKKARVIITASSTSGIYTGSVELYFTIDQADISSATIDSIADQKYTGSAIAPTPVVKLNGSTLSAIDYTVSYKNNTNVGTATLVVAGKGNYKGAKEATFKIAPRSGQHEHLFFNREPAKGNNGSSNLYL